MTRSKQYSHTTANIYARVLQRTSIRAHIVAILVGRSPPVGVYERYTTRLDARI